MEQYRRNNFRANINNYSVGDLDKNINFKRIKNPYNYLNNNILTSSNLKKNYHNQMKKNISEISKINYTSQNQNNYNFNQNNNEIIKLEHKLIESTTEDNEHPLRELLKGVKGVGWFSSRFSQYPQEIYIQFTQPVFLKQINMVVHEKYIPSKIKFYTFYPDKSNEIIGNYHNVQYKYIGFIKMDTNERSQFRARESRKVHVNTKALFFKIELGKNYTNEYNVFNQVGLMNLDFFGIYLPLIGNNFKKNQFILKHTLRKDNVNKMSDVILEDICGEELKELKEQMNYNIENENYMECKQIKIKLDKIRILGKQIYDLENQKKIAVNNEDYDQAMNLKNLVNKMKTNLKIITNSKINNNFPDIDGNNKYSQIGFNKNVNNNLNGFNNPNNAFINTNEFNKSRNINDNIHSNNNDHINNQLNQSDTKYLLNTNYSNNNFQTTKSNEDNFISYDDTILPAVLKKLTNEPKNEEEELGDITRGELEPVTSTILNEYKLIVDVIGELGIRKIFSKQIAWKDEGLKYFLENINDILDYNTSNKNEPTYINKIDMTNQIITCIMKLSLILLEERHPSVIIKTIDILKALFEYIKKRGTKLNIDLNITDSVLDKIKRKLGDVNKKIRAKAVVLYCYLLTLDFCDYNNLISELLEEELNYYDSKYIPKSPNLILGKLEIFNSVFDKFNEAVESKRTSLKTFPSNLIIEYLILNISNNKSEVRKLCRLNISKFIGIFGVNKIKKKLERIEERELSKLINEIPSLEPYFPKIIRTSPNSYSLSHINTSNESNNSKRKTKSKDKVWKIGERRKRNQYTIKLVKNYSLFNYNNSYEKNTKLEDNEKHKNKIKKKTNDFCDYCQRKMKTDELITSHWATTCPMFIRCEKCNMNLEIKYLTSHKLNECKFKNDFKECITCHEVLSNEEYNNHLRNKCGIKHGYVKCPLCHTDIQDNNKGYYQHLVKDGCPSNKRNNK